MMQDFGKHMAEWNPCQERNSMRNGVAADVRYLVTARLVGPLNRGSAGFKEEIARFDIALIAAIL